MEPGGSRTVCIARPWMRGVFFSLFAAAVCQKATAAPLQTAEEGNSDNRTVAVAMEVSWKSHTKSKHQTPSKQKKWCGPPICYNEKGVHCFDYYDASYCMKMVYICSGYVMSGCEETTEDDPDKDAHHAADGGQVLTIAVASQREAGSPCSAPAAILTAAAAPVAGAVLALRGRSWRKQVTDAARIDMDSSLTPPLLG